MKNLKSYLLALSLLLAGAAQAGGLKVQSYTASDAGFAVNSHLIEGQRDAVLVDAQFTRSGANDVANLILKSGKRLTTIFVTHGHPDHYFGLEVLAKKFPGAKIVATREVIRYIEATAQGKLAYWKPIYKDDLTDTIVMPEELSGNEIELEGEHLAVVELGPGESSHGTVVYLPGMKAVITGDLAFGGVHLWLAENRPAAWLNSLKQVRTIGPIVKVFPGHGQSGSQRLLDENRVYIERFLEITGGKTTPAEALARLKALYPTYRLPIIAELSVQAVVK